MTGEHIAAVIARLDDVVAWARGQAQPAGYFAALYREVTVRVAADLEAGVFEDPARMERFVVSFANRYLDAFRAWRDGRRGSKSWDIAFARTQSWRPVVLQHLLGAINAHINLDLGIAAVTVAPGDELASLKPDFERIQDVLGGLVQETKADLTKIWPPLRYLDWLAGEADDAIIRFSLKLAREGAWKFANRLAYLAPPDRRNEIAARDEVIGGRVARLVYRPGFFASGLLLVVRMGERGTVARKIGLLAGAGDSRGQDPGQARPAARSAGG